MLKTLVSPILSRRFVLLILALALPALADGIRAAKPPAAPLVSAAAGGPIAARVNGREVLQADIDRLLGAKLIEMLQAQYYARLNALPSLVGPWLEEEEARRRGITLDEFVQQEITSKIANPSEEEILALRSMMKDKLPDDPDAARDVIIRGLRNQRFTQRRAQLGKELYDKANVEILLEPPRIQIPDSPSSPAKGPANAAVTIVEFADFECTQCASLTATLKDLATANPSQIRIVFRQMPLSIHEHASVAASLALCAVDQGKFWELHDWLFANQRSLDVDSILAAAPALGIDPTALRVCQESGAHSDELETDLNMARALGVNTTPLVLVNGRPLVGIAALQQVGLVVADELRRAKKVPGTLAAPGP